MAWTEGGRYRYWLRGLVAGMLCLHVVFVWHARSKIAQGYADFTIFYSAAKIVRSGAGYDLYDPNLQYSVQRELAADVSIRQGPLPYNHPPYEALIFLPLTFLSYGYAFLAWDVVNVGLLLVVGSILRRRFPVLHGIGTWQWMAGVLAFYPVFVTLLQGQDSILLLVLFVFAFEALKREADFSAGCWLGLGMFRFPLVVPMVLVLLCWKRRRVVGGAALVSLGLSLLSAAIVGFSGLIQYPLYVWHLEKTTAGGTILPGLMANVRGLTSTLLGGIVSPGMLVAVTLAVSAALLWFAIDAGFAQAPFDLKFALALVATVLVSYHSYAYDWCLLILPLVIVTEHSLQSRQESLKKKLLPMVPTLPVLISPLYLVLWLRWHNLSLLAVPLLWWLWTIRRETSRTTYTP